MSNFWLLRVAVEAVLATTPKVVAVVVLAVIAVRLLENQLVEVEVWSRYSPLT